MKKGICIPVDVIGAFQIWMTRWTKQSFFLEKRIFSIHLITKDVTIFLLYHNIIYALSMTHASIEEIEN